LHSNKYGIIQHTKNIEGQKASEVATYPVRRQEIKYKSKRQ